MQPSSAFMERVFSILRACMDERQDSSYSDRIAVSCSQLLLWGLPLVVPSQAQSLYYQHGPPRPSLASKKEVRTSDILEPKGVPNNYVLHVLAIISISIRPIISKQTYILHVIILLAFW